MADAVALNGEDGASGKGEEARGRGGDRAMPWQVIARGR